MMKIRKSNWRYYTQIQYLDRQETERKNFEETQKLSVYLLIQVENSIFVTINS